METACGFRFALYALRENDERSRRGSDNGVDGFANLLGFLGMTTFCAPPSCASCDLRCCATLAS